MQLAIIIQHVLLCVVFVMFVYLVMCLFIQLHHHVVADCQHCHAIRLITVFDTHIVSVAAVAVKLHK